MVTDTLAMMLQRMTAVIMYANCFFDATFFKNKINEELREKEGKNIINVCKWFLWFLFLQVQTVLQYKAGLLTYLVAALICLFLTEIGLCWLAIVPFFVRELKDVYHVTPTDGKVVGVYKRLS